MANRNGQSKQRTKRGGEASPPPVPLCPRRRSAPIPPSLDSTPVGDEGKAPEARTLAQIAALNDRLDTLKALRDKLALAIDATESSRDLAALSRQLTDVLAQIEEIEKSLPAKKDTPLDAVKKNRAARSTRAKN